VTGPPPCARGQLHPLTRQPVLVRSTPVRTGTTTRSARRQGPKPVHPRAHGDNPVIMTCDGIGYGPPPCARGQHVPSSLRPLGLRSTPVRTGTTDSVPSLHCALAVHPRAHGDNIALLALSAALYGPPPCARGQLSGSGLAPGSTRSTPVRTGTTAYPAFPSLR